MAKCIVHQVGKVPVVKYFQFMFQIFANYSF